jgi:hypothetical protein
MIAVRIGVCALLSSSLVSAAQPDTSIVIPTTAGPTATPVPSANGYEYVGCWNETVDVVNSGGMRALSQVGNFVRRPSLPPSLSRMMMDSIPGFIHGCGKRDADMLPQSIQTANNSMTVDSCLAYCANANAQFAGLEFGRECYCSPYLSVLSERLNGSDKCNYACNGNSSQICGGMLALTLYNRTAGTTGVAWRLGSTEQATFYGFAAFVFMLVAAVL